MDPVPFALIVDRNISQALAKFRSIFSLLLARLMSAFHQADDHSQPQLRRQPAD